jgi:hypothetical protein
VKQAEAATAQSMKALVEQRQGNGDPYGCPGELTQNTTVGTPVESVPGLFYTKPLKLKKA